ncbi:MAG: hypothetical protein IPM29_00290 [Planctomycetes bacterium]|nr:hypothetical protein [Planctomycetota bacterium]
MRFVAGRPGSLLGLEELGREAGVTTRRWLALPQAGHLAPLLPPTIGTTLAIDAASPADAGLPYRMACAAGTTLGITLLDQRVVPRNADPVFVESMTLGTPLFRSTLGALDGNGQATGCMVIPNLPPRIGLQLHTALVVLDPAAPSLVRRVSRPVAIPFR